MRKKIWTPERILQEIRDQERKLGRVPKLKDVPSSLNLLSRQAFGSWDKAVELAISKPSHSHRWTNDEILQTLRSLHSRFGRFATEKDLDGVRTSLQTRICRTFGTLNKANEIAIGNSARIEALRVLNELTPPGCDNATTQEVRFHLGKKGLQLSGQMVGQSLKQARDDGYVITGKYDRTTWWKLTQKGREFLNEHRA